MKLRYAGKHEPFNLYQYKHPEGGTGLNVVSGQVVDVEPKLAAELLAKHPDKWFEEKDVKGKQAETKLQKEKEARQKAKEAAEAEKTKMAVNAGKTK